MAAMFLDHSRAVFVDADIFAFNNALAELSNLTDPHPMHVMIQRVLPRHSKIRLNLDSYQIIRRFCTLHRPLLCWNHGLGEVCAHLDHASISAILSRMHAVYLLARRKYVYPQKLPSLEKLIRTECITGRHTAAQWEDILREYTAAISNRTK